MAIFPHTSNGPVTGLPVGGAKAARKFTFFGLDGWVLKV